jgi:group I intron endonuclease
MGQLYLITFKTSGKSYVGISSKSAAHRWKYHIKPGNQLPIGRAFKKYGLADAVVTILAVSDSWLALCAMETIAIAEHKTMQPHGYNLTSGGEGVQGYVHTRAVRDAQSERSKKQFANPEFRASRMEQTKKQWTDPSSREYLLAMRKKAHQKPEVIVKFSSGQKRRFSEHAERAAASARAKKQWANPEARADMAARTKARFADPEQRTRLLMAQALGWAKKAGRPFSYIPQTLRSPAEQSL